MKRVFLLLYLAVLIPFYNTSILHGKREKRQSSCPDIQHRCKNNECINRNLICDGGKDCSDGSDETKELCKERSCPDLSFTCDYGGCINSSLKCNGVPDCVDGSDESSKLCELSTPPPTTPPPSFPDYFLGRPCQRPPKPANGIIETACGPTCTSIVHFGVIIIKCDKGYIAETPNYAYCNDSRFTASLTCKPMTCPPVEDLSTTFICFRHEEKLENCNKENLILKTIVNYKCKYGYEKYPQPTEKQSSECILKNNKQPIWDPPIFECVPECGLTTPKGTGLIAGGKEAIPNEHPWHCGVYKEEYSNNQMSELICGGTLVSRYFVLSVAHCFNEPHKPELYRIIFGKIHRSYAIRDQTQREYQIRKIIKHENFTDDIFNPDISFIVLKKEVQFSATLMPACIDFNKLHFDILLVDGQRGQLAGWGLDSNNLPSDTLQYTDLEYHNMITCRNHTSVRFRQLNTPRKFCAGTIGGPSVCLGDSGGGLVFKAKEGPPNWYLMGILSTGVASIDGSCVRDQYTLFTSIRNELDFIIREFKRNTKYKMKKKKLKLNKSETRLSCLGHSFTCESGGCINGSLKCNGVSDCVDGSDESSKICELPTSTSPSPPAPTPTSVPLYPISGGRPCERPSNPPNGIIESICGNCTSITNYVGINIKCDKGYIPEKTTHAYCIDSRFTSSLTCKPMTCPPVEALSTTSICFRNGEKLDNCNEVNLFLNTTVNYKCKYGYQQTEQPPEKQSSECILTNDNKAIWHPSIFECVPECGLNTPKGSAFIAGGKEAIPIEHPWHCGVYKKNITNELYKQICGGTLVSRYFVISAAHCFNEPHKPELYRIIFGKIHRSYGIQDQIQREYQIRKIINHEFFSDAVFEFDISFIVLKQEVEYSATLMPACIDFQKKHFDILLNPGQRGQVAGWGLNSNNVPSPTLQYTDLEYHNSTECKNQAPYHFEKFITPRKFCAGSIRGSNVCPGDSGGGLVFKAKEGPPNWYLMGIVSTGVTSMTGSCMRSLYGVFTSIRNDIDFIEREFKSNVKYTNLKD